MKFFIGVMSKNVVDNVIKFANERNEEITFIPSRRQVDYDGGYVNNWTTADFVSYVKSRNGNIKIERDHSGNSQGTYEDDGYNSLRIDCEYMDIIHIDPFKKFQNFQDGLNETIKMIEFCHNLNKDIEFEIGTEEAIRKFEVEELEMFVEELKKRLSSSAFDKIKYLVVQAGTALNEKSNIGIYDEKKLKKMIGIAKKFNLISKEHNGDWVDNKTILNKYECGLECINIAPEFGEIETSIYLKYFKEYGLFEDFFDICLKSGKWKKWVSSSFIPEENKEKLVLICGHYTFSYPSFLELRKQLKVPIDDIISSAIMNKLNNLYGIFRRKVLITTSGIGSRLGNLTKFINKSLIRVGNKFAICHIIDKFDYRTTDFIITLGYQGNLVKEFLEMAYDKHNFIFVNIENYDGDGSSLVHSQLECKNYLQSPFLFFCCDSIINDDIIIDKLERNYLFVAKSNEGSLYSSINIIGNEIMKVNNKGEKDFDYVYTGVSYIYDYENYWNTMMEIYDKNHMNRNLSDIDVISLLINNNTKFYYKIVEEWFDIGNINSYNIALNKIKCDYEILHKDNEGICFMETKVIKFINNSESNLKKIERGKRLYPKTPKILNEGNYFYGMELVKGTILSKIKRYGEIYKLLNWSYKNLWINKEINDDFIKICNEFYKEKTYKRLNDLKIFNFKDYEIINGIKIGTINELLLNIDWNSLNTNEFYEYHGDFIMDNIIYDNDNNYKLIDWREDFCNNINKGDMYYDLAKLRHNIIFNHNNINRGLFDVIVIDDNEIMVDLKCNYLFIQQLEDFDKFVIEKNLNLKKIKILTSLIWLNMSPLHEYNISKFLFYFSKYNLFKELFDYNHLEDEQHPIIHL